MRITANRGLAVVGGAIVVIGIIVASLASSWTVPQRDPASPEGVVQTYVQAIADHNAAAALAVMTPDTECTIANFQQTYFDESSRMTLVDTKTDGDAATVHVRIEHGGSDPFGGSWTEDQYFQLVRVSGAWRMQGSPWPVYNCGDMVK